MTDMTNENTAEASRPVASGAGRFRPASPADFTQYAKNLAWLLRCKLQVAQELLATVYGYASAHELRAELAKPFAELDAAGPYDGPTRWPLFSVYANDVDWEDRESGLDSLSWLKGTSFDARLLIEIQSFTEGRFLNRRQLGALEAGFFCSPKEHRLLFKHVKAGCLALEGTPAQHQAWLEMNWPVGHWALLRTLYGHPYSWRPDGSLDPFFVRLCRSRAAAIYLHMTSGLTRPVYEVAYDSFCEPGNTRLDGGQVGLFAEEHEAWYHFLDELLEQERSTVVSDEAWDKVIDSCDAYLKTRCTDTSTLHPLVRDNTGVIDFIKSFRLKHLRTKCKSQSDVEAQEQLVVLGSRSAWPDQATEDQVKAMDFMELVRFRRQEMDFMLDCQLRLVRDSFHETEGCHMSLWRYVAVFTRIDGVAETTVQVGVVHGWYIVPFDAEGPVLDGDLYECMDASSAQLNDVWKVLVGEYFPNVGIDSVNDFMNEDGQFACLATAEIDIETRFRGQGLVPALLNTVDKILADASFRSADGNWKACALAAADLDHDDGDELDEGIAHFTAPGVFIIPVEGDPSEDRTMRPHLRGVLNKVRKPINLTEKEHLKHKLIRHFEAMRDRVHADIVCYDPNEYPAT